MSFPSDFIPLKYNQIVEKGSFQWSAPSNIALVKYWGKKEDQIPANPSISFTLKNCKTSTKLSFSKIDRATHFSFDLLFEGQPKDSFRPKIEQFLKRIEVYLPFLKTIILQLTHRTHFHTVLELRLRLPEWLRYP